MHWIFIGIMLWIGFELAPVVVHFAVVLIGWTVILALVLGIPALIIWGLWEISPFIVFLIVLLLVVSLASGTSEALQKKVV